MKDDSSNDHYMVDSSHTNSSNGVRAIVYRANGRAAQTGFLTIMEGVVEVGDSTPNSSRLNRANIRVMEISQYSGQVKFRY